MKKYILLTHDRYESKDKYIVTEFDALDQLHTVMKAEKDEDTIHIIAKPITLKITIEEEQNANS